MENEVIHIDIEKMLLTSNGKTNLTVKTEIDAGELAALFAREPKMEQVWRH